ncbi:MAG: hypothetical protein LUD03_00380 [Firmicutes bacterium]|nr:hypothetical protein [Bacillota bacterium]
MKKIFSLLLICAALVTASSCVKNAEDAVSTAEPSESASASTPKPTLAPEATGEVSSLIEKIPASEAENAPEKEETSVEKNFSGDWIAYASTTQNSSLETVEITISYTGYTVKMSFSSGDVPTVEYSGTYKIKKGILTFDENFSGCTAYFYEGDKETLVLDNGTSLIYCKVADNEEE